MFRYITAWFILPLDNRMSFYGKWTPKEELEPRLTICMSIHVAHDSREARSTLRVDNGSVTYSGFIHQRCNPSLTVPTDGTHTGLRNLSVLR